MAKRKPQINFQVDEAMKTLYDESRACGHWVTRFCAAGFLLMVEDPAVRMRALNRLREWESEFSDADEERIRDFVQGAQGVLEARAPDNPPKRTARRARKKAKR